jgi:oxygen-independent coproporphyrinogen-3 oxidase
LTLAPPEASLADAVEAPPVALYLHIPFCVSHCPYCDFVVVAGREARGPANRIDVFVAALEAELALRADALDARWGPIGAGTGARLALDSVYFGGGTPSLLPAEAINRLLGLIRRRFGIAPGAEVTLEANPGPDERGDAGALRAAGVTRLSIGAQSMDAAELRALGRRHTPDDVAATVHAARDAGIESISLDLLYDVPGQTLDTWATTLDAALATEPDHVSMYALTLDDPDAEGITGPNGDHLPVSDGARRWRERARVGQDDDRAAQMYELADQRLASAGFDWYEISNWARPGHESRHNVAYWQGRSWQAVGPGAHAFDGRTRRWNAARLDRYMDALQPTDGAPPRLPPGSASTSGAEESEVSAAMLALRTRSGLKPTASQAPTIAEAVAWGLEAGLLAENPDCVVLTMRGRLLANELFVRMV